jgi:hypothetical protein
MIVDEIPAYLYAEIKRYLHIDQLPDRVSRAWLDEHYPGSFASSANPIYYIQLSLGFSIRLANGIYLTASTYLPLSSITPGLLCYYEGMELGVYQDVQSKYKVHTTPSLYGLKYTREYFVKDTKLTNICCLSFSPGIPKYYREISVNGRIRKLPFDSVSLVLATERCNLINKSKYVTYASRSNLLYKVLMSMINEYKVGDELVLLDSGTDGVNQKFTEFTHEYNTYLDSSAANVTVDWVIRRMYMGDWDLLCKLPEVIPSVYSQLIYNPEHVKSITLEIFNSLIAERKINAEIVRKFTKVNALKYGRDDLVRYIGETETRCRRPSPLGY